MRGLAVVVKIPQVLVPKLTNLGAVFESPLLPAASWRFIFSEDTNPLLLAAVLSALLIRSSKATKPLLATMSGRLPHALDDGTGKFPGPSFEEHTELV